MGHFQLEEYDQAIEKWEEGFRIKPVPEFLYNIAQAYRLSKRPEKALSFYQKYLRASPTAKNRAEVERHIATLQRVVDEQQRVARQPPDQPLDTGHPSTPATVTATPPTAAATPPPTAPAPALSGEASLTARPPARREPITHRKWFWPVVGGGAAIVVGAVVVGVVLGTRGDGYKSLPDLRFQ